MVGTDAIWNLAAPELFLQRFLQAVEGLEGVYPIADDVLIVGDGESDEEACVVHDRRLQAFLIQCMQGT